MGCPTGNTSALTNPSNSCGGDEDHPDESSAFSADSLTSLLPLPTSPLSERGTARDVNKFGSLYGRHMRNSNSQNSSSSSDPSSSLSSFYSLPGVNTYQPMPATENAVQMINSCYHNSMNILLGRDNGDAFARNGGEYHHDAVKYMKFPHKARIEAIEGINKNEKVLEQLQKAENEKNKNKMATGKSGKVTISMLTKRKSPLSETASRLLKEASGYYEQNSSN